MPTLKACRQIHWQPLLNLLEGQPFVENISRTDFRIKLKGNKPDILLRGADNNGDSLRGLKCYYVGVDEFQDFSLKAWEDVIYPTLADTPNSKALLIGTPKGKSHFLYKFHQQAKSSKDWSYFHFITEDNPFVPRRYLEQAKLSLPPRVYKQEFEASFEDFEGQFYTQFNNHHIVDNLPNFEFTYLGIDWGDINPALSVIGFTKDRKYYLIDAWENNSQTPVVIDDFINKAVYFCNKYNIWRGFADPSRPSSIIEFQKVGRKKGIKGLAKTIAGFNKVNEGIQIVDSLFYQDRFFVHSSLLNTINQIRSYHREVKDGIILDIEAANQQTHVLDCIRYTLATLEKRI
ncbi:hypothetical protein [Nostoc sp. PCC 7524]|uniref:hypothetical protein n=1 Tax=Nostoc sp. (strain ATCC 29411 / PCC 7524) TaxID=28072 RepID=UPI0014941719|nr:hypothetical protein [Nostoc sp. PCC 7524]